MKLFLITLLVAAAMAAVPRRVAEKVAAKLKADDECGVNQYLSDDMSKIVGGEEADKNSWPWMASVRFAATSSNPKPGHICGGTIVGDRWIMTAGHCMMNSNNPRYYRIVIGEHNKETEHGDEVWHEVEALYQHPDFTINFFGGAENDVALFKLTSPIDLSDSNKAQKSCLPTADQNTDNMDGTASGWGYTHSPDGSESPILQMMTAPINTDEQCLNWWGSYLFKFGMICYGEAYGDSSPCQGDSGGPLQIKSADGSHWIQVGITSYGESRCYGKPSVYTRISSFIDWITMTMENN